MNEILNFFKEKNIKYSISLYIFSYILYVKLVQITELHQQLNALATNFKDSDNFTMLLEEF